MRPAWLRVARGSGRTLAVQSPAGPQEQEAPDSSPAQEPTAAASLVSGYLRTRRQTERLCEPLNTEDYVVQSMDDVSPAKWHLAHTTWFFETFLLLGPDGDGRPYREEYRYLFNSYYNAVGTMHPRPQRGLLSRPTVDELYAYRRNVDERLPTMLGRLDQAGLERASELVELGMHHEQQHQELILTDIKHVLSCNPLKPVYLNVDTSDRTLPSPLGWIGFPEGLYWIGRSGPGFAYDNEGPRHQIYAGAFELATREVTCQEYLEFIEDGGYQRPEFWLSDGWATVQKYGWESPLYWHEHDGLRTVFTLGGERKLNPADPVCHVSHYEADAFARWAGARLPTEAEWEIAAHDPDVEDSGTIEGNFVEDRLFHPCAPTSPLPARSFSQMYGGVWEWTGSPYVPYHGYKPGAGALGEYNGKFMSGQMVLRGGSCATPRRHIRRSYRNFFPPNARWQFSGLRLARDIPVN